MKTALVIMAAGMGSRFGGGIKQLEPVGPNGEIIMDYSIHDAIEAGFNKVVFIIRKDIKEAFHDAIGKRIEGICNRLNVEFAYAYQELDDLPEEIKKPVDRSKPWGTGQAVLVCKDIIKEPFVVINADDYYGKEAFKEAYSYLTNLPSADIMQICMVSFVLKNTLSDNGGVTRGVCEVDGHGMLADIEETHNIEKEDGKAVIHKEDGDVFLDVDSPVSMNMWGITPEFFEILKTGFDEFLEKTESTDLKAEYLLPTMIGDLLSDGKLEVKVLQSHDQWFGVTYKEDKESVTVALRGLIEEGVYPSKLF